MPLFVRNVNLVCLGADNVFIDRRGALIDTWHIGLAVIHTGKDEARRTAEGHIKQKASSSKATFRLGNKFINLNCEY